jgi:hypothetical protein
VADSSSPIEFFWKSPAMSGESLFFIGDDERATATLLFPPERIVSVTGEIEYEDGRDYAVDDQSGCITRFAGSRMPFTSNAELSPPLTGPGLSAMPRRGSSASGLMSAEGDAFHRRQVAVTYIHQPHLWRGPVPRFADRELANTFSHLTASRRLTICLMSNSISEGYNASGFTGVVLADVTSLWSALLTRKSHHDLSGNGINHPKDFAHRLYAETILGLLIET